MPSREVKAGCRAGSGSGERERVEGWRQQMSGGIVCISAGTGVDVEKPDRSGLSDELGK